MPLQPEEVRHTSADFLMIPNWSFATEPFYVPQVGRVFASDIPKRMTVGRCRTWLYRDEEGLITAAGTLDVSRDYSYQFEDGHPHLYIPVLTANPELRRKGVGTEVMFHLLDQAHELVLNSEVESPFLYLDVYIANEVAMIGIYQNKFGFETLNLDAPILDPDENNEPYVVMRLDLTDWPSRRALFAPR